VRHDVEQVGTGL